MSFELPPTYARYAPASYVIYKEGDYIIAKACLSGLSDYKETDASTVIQAAINALPTYGGVIFVKDPMTFASAVTINKSYVTIKTDRIKESNSLTESVLFYDLVFDSTNNEVVHINLQGLQFKRLQFNVGSGGIIGYVHIADCSFVFGTSSYLNGIKVSGSANYIYDVWIDRCLFWDWSGWSSSGGAIYFAHSGSAGNGQIFIRDCIWYGEDNGSTFLRLAGGHIDSIWISGLTALIVSGKTGCQLIHLKNGSFLNAWVEDCLFEPKESWTILNIDNGTTNTMHINAHFNSNHFLTGSAGKTCTLITNNADNTDWINWMINIVRFQDNILMDNSGTLSVGTPAVGTQFQFVNRGWKGGFITENSGTATIPSGQTSVTFAHGINAGIPNIVTLGATHAEVADAIWSANATNITITVPSAVSANRNISWYAEYKL